MTTSVSGDLRLVTDAPAMLVQVLVRAPRPRPHAGGMVVDFTTPATVEDGTVSFPCVPGPAVLSVMNASVPQVTVPLVVPDKASATLEECIRAAELADTATRSELEDLARRVVEGVATAESSAAAAQESAAAADADAREVASAREIIDGYRAQTGEDREAAEQWAGQSKDAATLAITAAATVTQYVGDGSPEGRVAAPVGAVYTDRLATAGAVRWIKTTGTENTGWQVGYGDTGWRDVSGMLINGWEGNLFVKRTGNLVSYRGRLSAASATNANAWDIPSGFHIGTLRSVGGYDYGTAQVWTDENLPMIRRVSFYFQRFNISSYQPGEVYVVGLSYTSTNSWPSTLPGVPA